MSGSVVSRFRISLQPGASGTLAALPWVLAWNVQHGDDHDVPIAWMIGLSLVLQIPPPETGPPVSVESKETRRAIEEREAKAVESLAVSDRRRDGPGSVGGAPPASTHASRAMVPAG